MKKELLLIVGWVFLGIAASTCRATDDTTGAKSRSFEFKYGATVSDVPDGASVRVWFPIAESNGQQTVTVSNATTLVPLQKNRDKKYKNLIGYFELQSTKEAEVEFGLTYDVHRQEAGLDDSEKKLSPEQKKLFLSANSLVPIEGKPQELIKDVSLPTEALAAGQTLYNVVEEHMKYDKSNPGYGNGDAIWACDSQTGNCTDFHSLFISLARSRSLPSRFEIGFPIPNDKKAGPIGGYHCWAWFHIDGQGWAPVDISEADKHPEMKDYYFGKLTTDRVSFSTGRDIVLVPESKSGPRNFFVYPHVEVDGKPWPKEKVQLNFSFRDK